MAVLLTILKVAGIIILAVIALILLLILLILFVPIRYRINAEKEDDGSSVYAKAKVSFLLHIISAVFAYEDDIYYHVKVFGIKIYPKKEKKDSKEEELSVSADVTDAADETGEAEEANISSWEDIGYSVDWNDEADGPDDTAETDTHTASEDTTTDDKAAEKGEEDGLWDRIDALIEKLSDKFHSISEKYETVKKKAAFWKRMADDRRNRQAVEKIKNAAVKVLKKAAPRRIKGLVHFGSDDPATTGRILAFLGIMYPILPKKLTIEPDFEEALIYGNIDIKGRIAIITPAWAFLKLFLDKDCRRMWNIYKKHSSKEDE